mmetsp:Transcript_9965/g.18799  ORF Transcript_9965/g.18799 Transcript_9965/m.18799 type:complete len:231 (-) Transcript_9965:488-1180(-)
MAVTEESSPATACPQGRPPCVALMSTIVISRLGTPQKGAMFCRSFSDSIRKASRNSWYEIRPSPSWSISFNIEVMAEGLIALTTPGCTESLKLRMAWENSSLESQPVPARSMRVKTSRSVRSLSTMYATNSSRLTSPSPSVSAAMTLRRNSGGTLYPLAKVDKPVVPLSFWAYSSSSSGVRVPPPSASISSKRWFALATTADSSAPMSGWNPFFFFTVVLSVYACAGAGA